MYNSSDWKLLFGEAEGSVLLALLLSTFRLPQIIEKHRFSRPTLATGDPSVTIWIQCLDSSVWALRKRCSASELRIRLDYGVHFPSDRPATLGAVPRGAVDRDF
jgi:hypothetical protein